VVPKADHRNYDGTEGSVKHDHAHSTADDEEVNVHLPNPSIYPLIVAIGLFIGSLGMLIDGPTITIGLLTLPILFIVGILVTLASVYGWAFEPAG
jgi:hypothetical protein